MNVFTIFLILTILATVVYIFAAAITVSTLWKALIAFVLIYIAVNLLFALVLWIISLFLPMKPLEDKQNRLARIGCVLIAQFVVGYGGVRTTIVGKEKIPTDSRFLFISNHKSNFDPLILMAELPEYDITFVSKPENVKIPLAGKYAFSAGCIAMDRENNREALKSILLAADYMKKDICSISIYPEGTRSKTNEMLPFHAGSFKIAQRAGVPVVVACTKGTEKLKKNAFKRRTDITLEVLEVIPAEQVKTMSTNELSDYSRSLIEKTLGGYEHE